MVQQQVPAVKQRKDDTRSSTRAQLFATMVALLLVPTASVVDREDFSSSFVSCPFLAALGATTLDRDEAALSGDLWQMVVGMDDKHRTLQKRRYDHYKSGSAYHYKNYRNKNEVVYSSLMDIWLCLACAVGWTVWLVSVTQSSTTSSGVGSTLFEEQESKEVIGNVLQVTLGEDPDGTGIPVYHTLVDYVVENHEDPEQAPLQVRKCFTTGILFEEGFANVKVMVLLEDPTTSILKDDFIKDRNARNQEQLEPPDMIYSTLVYLIAAILILTSLFGGLHAYFRLDPQQKLWGGVSFGLGTLLVYPVALLLCLILKAGYRWITPLIERPGVIIYGAKNCWDHKCGADFDPMVLMGNSFDTSSSFGPSMNEPVVGVKPRLSSRRSKKRRGKSSLPDVMEMSTVASSNSLESAKEPKLKQQHDAPVNKFHSLYPNAGCGFGNFNVLLPTGRAENGKGLFDRDKEAYDLAVDSVSSISSAETGLNGITRRKNNKKSNESSPPPAPMPMMDESEYDLNYQQQSVEEEPLSDLQRMRLRSIDQQGSPVVAGYLPPAPLLSLVTHSPPSVGDGPTSLPVFNNYHNNVRMKNSSQRVHPSDLDDKEADGPSLD